MDVVGVAVEWAAAYDDQMRERRVSARGDAVAHPGVLTERAGPVLRKVVPGLGGTVMSADLDGLDGRALDAVVADQRARAVELGVPITWYHHDGLRADLPDRLTAFEFTEHQQVAVVIGRAAEAAAVHRSQPGPRGVRLRTVTTRRDFGRVRALTEAVRDEDRSWLPEALERWVVDQADPCAVVVAETGAGEVVSTMWVRFHLGTDFASMWGASTLPAWRGRGLCGALTGHCAVLAAESGFRYLQGESLRASRPVADRLGCVVVRTVTPYCFVPPAGRPTPGAGT